MKANFEQQPAGRSKSNESTVVIDMKKTGDDGVDAALYDHYESIGYNFKEERRGGTVVMESPRALQEKRAQDAITLHNSRTGITPGMRVERGSIVKDTHERQGKKSASDFMGQIESVSPQTPDDDEL